MSAIPPVPPNPPVNETNWFVRAPTGGTAYERRPSATFEVTPRFREMPTGGGTCNVRPGGGGETGGENGDK